jgi:cholinesterase
MKISRSAPLVFLSLSFGADAQVTESWWHSGWKVGQAVDTTSGRIIGHAAPNATHVSEYLGIPYAKPPVGKLRFAAPKRFEGNGEIRAAKFVRLDLPLCVPVGG